MNSDRWLARMRELCGELGPDDGIDPRDLKKPQKSDVPSPTPAHDPKLARLGGQICRALNLALGASSDPVLCGAWIARAEPAPDASRFRVVAGSTGDPDTDSALAAHLTAIRGWLRAEVAHAIRRRRVPELVFTVAHAPVDDGAER